MKKLLLFFTALIMLTSCSSDRVSDVANASAKKPRLPSIPSVSQENLQANLLGATNSVAQKNTKNNEDNMKELIERINHGIEQRNISLEDIERGWYYGSEDEKKWGMPITWIWLNEGSKSRWISPIALARLKDIEVDKLCRETDGYYVISCAESDLPHCVHIPKNECRCPDYTKWKDYQGCILINEDERFAEISDNEINSGWYSGPKSGKKLNTPATWIWSQNNQNPRWQNPGAL